MVGWPAYFVFCAAWAVLGAGILATEAVNPVAIGIVWLVGFVWLTGWLADGPKSADALVKMWLLSLALFAIAAGAIVALMSLFS